MIDLILSKNYRVMVIVKSSTGYHQDYMEILLIYCKLKLRDKKSKLCSIQGINIINANKIGNITVQQNDINWSKRILGKDALAQINVKIIIELFRPKVKPYNNPSKLG